MSFPLFCHGGAFGPFKLFFHTERKENKEYFDSRLDQPIYLPNFVAVTNLYHSMSFFVYLYPAHT